MNLARLLPIVLLACLGSACVTLNYGKPPQQRIEKPPTSTVTKVHFLWGLVGDSTVAAQMCPEDRPDLDAIESSLQGWAFLTLGLVTVTNVRIYCQ